MLSFNAQAVGLAVGCAVPDPMAALAAAPIILIPLMMFAGFFKSLDDIPSWFAWIQYISPFKYGYEMLVVNEFTDLPIECSIGNYTCGIDNGNQVLRVLNLDEGDVWAAVVALLLQALVWHLVAIAALHIWYAYSPPPPRAAMQKCGGDRVAGAHSL